MSTPSATSPSLAAPRPRRSRNGCLGCRKARVKCDEIRPRCGTCHRRNLKCPGYSSQPRTTSSASNQNHDSPADRAIPAGEVVSPHDTRDNPATSPSVLQPVSDESHEVSTPQISQLASSSVASTASRPANHALPLSASSVLPPYQIDMLGSSLSLIPQNTVSPAEERNIALYFHRHPAELVIGDEFVPEMNANTLLLLQQDPATVANVLAAIGYVYQVKDIGGSDDSILVRRSRILTDLRLIKPSSSYFEMALHLLLALCAMEVSLPFPRCLCPH